MDDVEFRLQRAVNMARVILLCRDPVDGELYETAALKFKSNGYMVSDKVKSHEALRGEIEEN